ncbi:MAG: Co2+/Mg2+ efflux protein ApaG [Saprospiraceae bacterium]
MGNRAQLNYLAAVEIKTTNGITVSVETQFVPEHSDPKGRKFIFAYHISIENGSDHTVQLLRRHWYIYDSAGIIREVEGEGVVGQQPILKPGEVHRYNSFCDLETDMGKMKGTFMMTRHDDGSYFDVIVPEFKMFLPEKMN